MTRVVINVYNNPLDEELDPWTDFYVVLHDFQTKAYHRDDLGYSVPRSLYSKTDGLLNNRGYPETCRLWSESGEGTPLTADLQWFWFNLCVYKRYHTFYNSPGWKALSREAQRAIATEWGTFSDSRRVLTNHAGTDIRRNFVAEKILDQVPRHDLPIYQNIVMGGNVVLAKSGIREIKDGEQHIEIVVWNGIAPEPHAATLNWRTNPELVHWATNSTPFGADGQVKDRPLQPPWRVDAFSFFDGGGSPYMVLSHERQWIALERVRRLRKSELFPSPYVLPKA